MRKIILGIFICTTTHIFSQQMVSEKQGVNAFEIVGKDFIAPICFDRNDVDLVQKSASLLQQDIEAVTGKKPAINSGSGKTKGMIIVGSIPESKLIQYLVSQKKINLEKIKGKWEAYQIQVVPFPMPGVEKALVIAGSDRRGTAFGVFEISKQMGVSPWYWWADVPVKKRAAIYITVPKPIIDSPKVKYRGIFINDEAPALSGWSKEKFGGFNHLFYEKVFELILRLKGNYLWPAMWGNAFYDDDSLNMRSADEYGIVIGTSHHEPLMRAHDEWRRYGKGLWDYDSNEVRLKEFWRQGMQRATNEKIVSIGMRGDGDKPMSDKTATALLERIVSDQRKIIEEVTGKPASQTPQLWALYKEVQDYYDKGMRVPDDVTLLLCDDNWGNIRKLPKLDDKPRSGGYGIYYHFDYVGGPRNYKWINTNPIPRVWEQMHLAWEYNARQIWIVNVGDIKPMEFPISFFLDYAWNPTKIGADDLQRYTENWAAQQFGKTYAREIANMIAKYAKYNGRRKPELLNENTYSIYHYSEAENFSLSDFNLLVSDAEEINKKISPEYRDAYYQLVLYPLKASANLVEMYMNVALNKFYANKKSKLANQTADRVKELYHNDSMMSLIYNTQIANGKWNHMMDQVHIGYTYWQQPDRQKMPAVIYIPENSIETPRPDTAFPLGVGYISIEGNHFSRAINTSNITWKILPDHGRTGSAVTAFPVTAARQTPGKNSPRLEYDIYVKDTGAVKLLGYFSPTLNFHNDPNGLQYAISIDNETPQVISINKEDNNVRAWSEWVSNNIIIKTTKHTIIKPGKHIVKFWMVDPAVVLQKLVLDLGGLQSSYLGPPETIIK